LGGSETTMKTVLEVKQLCKSYQKNVVAAHNVSFSIREGEFVTLLGPSGCGKTTTLRMIAGFEFPDSGQVILDDQEVSNQPPYKRPVNMMFQDFALWPHMSVEKNIGYGLMIAGEKKTAISEKVMKVLDLVDLKQKAANFPQELSIGQKQRIALARAIVNEPRILLLDEPMSALDAKLREAMQTELRELQKSLQITFVMVTHDQTEAMRMSDRIIVMKAGEVEQIGTPTELYETPRSPYVADFLGQSNILVGKINNQAGINYAEIASGQSLAFVNRFEHIQDKTKVIICIRPEKIQIEPKNKENPDKVNIVTGTVVNSAYSGNSIRYVIEIDKKTRITVDQQLMRSIDNSDVAQFGDKVDCLIPPDAISVFFE